MDCTHMLLQKKDGTVMNVPSVAYPVPDGTIGHLGDHLDINLLTPIYLKHNGLLANQATKTLPPKGFPFGG